MASAWGVAFGQAWGVAWGSVGSVTPPPTSAGGVSTGRRPAATSWSPKTLSALRQEKRAEIARLRRVARQRLEKAVAAGQTDRHYLLTLAEQRIEQAMPDAEWLDRQIVGQLAQEFVAALFARLDEEDAEALLLSVN